MMERRSAVTWLPWEVAMCTSRPPVASRSMMLGKVVAADHVEDGIDAVRLGPAGDFRGPVPGVLSIIDGDFGAQTEAEAAFLVRAGGGGDAGAESAGHLDGHGADAARAALHQEEIAGKEAAWLEKIGPYGDGRLGNSCRVANRDTGGHRHALAFGHGAIFGIASAGQQGADRRRPPASGNWCRRPARRCARRPPCPGWGKRRAEEDNAPAAAADRRD